MAHNQAAMAQDHIVMSVHSFETSAQLVKF